MSEPVTITQRQTGYIVLMADAPMVSALDAFGRMSDDLAAVRRMIAHSSAPERYRIVQVETVHTLTPLADEGGGQ